MKVSFFFGWGFADWPAAIPPLDPSGVWGCHVGFLSRHILELVMFSYSLILLHVFPINGKKRICVHFLFEDSFRVLKINKAKKVRAWQRWRREPANVFELPSFALPSSLLLPPLYSDLREGGCGGGGSTGGAGHSPVHVCRIVRFHALFSIIDKLSVSSKIRHLFYNRVSLSLAPSARRINAFTSNTWADFDWVEALAVICARLAEQCAGACVRGTAS